MSIPITPEMVRKIEVGDMLTGNELRLAFEFYRDLEQKLRVLGPKFHFPWVECQRRMYEMEGYIKNRKEQR